MIKVIPDRISTATGETLISVDTGSFDAETNSISSQEDSGRPFRPGFILTGNDTYRPSSLLGEQQKRQYALSRGHIKRAYNSVRQLAGRYRPAIKNPTKQE